jgi:HemY protein
VIRLLGFLLKFVAVVALAIWLADRPGTARIIWHDYIIETSAAFLGLCVLAAGFVLYLLFRFWHLLKHGPQQWRMHRKLRLMRQGHDKLTKGLIAIAGGNASEAGKLAVAARKALGTTALTQLLQAQAAQLAGDHRTARDIFRSLAAKSESAVLGYRGLIMEARRTEDWNEVGHLAERLQQAAPNLPWLNLVQFECLARRQEWQAADHALAQAGAARLLDTPQLKQNHAALLVAQSQSEATQGHDDKALQLAEQAVKQAPNWLPALINLARKQMMAGHRRAAHRTIEKNWPHHPHPQLAAIYRAGSSDALEAYKHVQHLCRSNETDASSRMALAEAALAADIWGEARRHLIALISRNAATQETYRLLSRLEKRETGDERASLQWLVKAVDAAPDATWLCQSCGGAHEEWQPICTHCGSFNTQAWQRPGISRATHATSPLLANDILNG